MKLQSRHSSYHLTILGYQHPDAAGEPYDANWLSIQVEAAGVGPDSKPGAWTGTDPCLLTYEVSRLADWLEAVAAGKETAPAISFLEPVLLFRLVDTPDGRALRAHFGNLIHPSWRVLSGEPLGDNPDLWLDFPLAEIDLGAAGRELRQEVKRYPSRAKDD